MAKTPLDQLGLIDGNSLSASDLLLLTDASIQRGPTGDRPTGSRRFAGKHYFDTTLNELIYWDGTQWRGTRPHQVSQSGAATGPFSDNSIHVALSGTLPDYGVPGWWLVTGRLGAIRNVGGVTFSAVWLGLVLGGTEVVEERVEYISAMAAASLTGTWQQAAGSTTSVQLTYQQPAPGDLPYTSTNDYRFNRIDSIFFPD